MIHKVEIQNFKSVENLTLGLGRFNVLIGENGSGKSNILEAVAFASCALTGKLNASDDGKGFEEYVTKSSLELKGVRIAEPKNYRSGFAKEYLKEQINIFLYAEDDYRVQFEINHSNKPHDKWESFIPINGLDNLAFSENQDVAVKNAIAFSRVKINSLNIQDFMIYSPENYFVRSYNANENIYNEPIGFRGEGLLKLFRLIATEQPEQFQEIVGHLQLFDWFETIELSTDKILNETEFVLKDRYLEEGLNTFGLINTNEGFYFLLFYLTLFISDYTPKFFAIDNIDTALNPKLCSRLMTLLYELAVKHDKQVICTTHNPSVLDGLNLNSDDQRLYAISRNKLGHTKATRIEKKPSLEGVEPLKLSEQFLRGNIGALPKNF